MNEHNYTFDFETQTLMKIVLETQSEEEALIEAPKTKAVKKTKKYSCDLCLKNFNNKTQLLKHVRKHNQNYTCDYCDSKYSNYSFLRTHNMKNHGILLPQMNAESHNCVLCSGDFSSRDYYNHLYQVHDYIYPNKVACEKCNKVIGLESMIYHSKKC